MSADICEYSDRTGIGRARECDMLAAQSAARTWWVQRAAAGNDRGIDLWERGLLRIERDARRERGRLPLV